MYPRSASIFRRDLWKRDGRGLWLYARKPLSGHFDAPTPRGEAPTPNPHLRWHPFRGEWISYAGHRQHRTFMPPAEFDPLAPTTDPANPTEVPSGDWEVAVFENRFPTLSRHAGDPERSDQDRPARGQCEVVVYTQSAEGALGTLPLSRIELVLRVWADRTRELSGREDIAYVMPFENRGVEVGVTLPHPHGQLYGYPDVPPVAARELALQRRHLQCEGTGLLASIIEAEIASGARVVSSAPSAIAFVPAFARYAYEIWVAPVRAVPLLTDLQDHEVEDLARVLKRALMKLDGLWSQPMPYILGVHQAPTDGSSHPEAHVHIEIYPALRMKNRLKYLAGSEVMAGFFTADTVPEEKARELRSVETE